MVFFGQVLFKYCHLWSGIVTSCQGWSGVVKKWGGFVQVLSFVVGVGKVSQGLLKLVDVSYLSKC